MLWEILGKINKVVYYHNLFEEKGLLSKNISANYEAVSDSPWLYFNNPSDKDLSFRIHNLEFGKERQGEAAFLHTAAQRGKYFKFEGFISRLNFLGFKRIRGYLEVPSDNHKLGIVANKGRVNELMTIQEILEMSGFLPFLLYAFEHPKKTTLVDKV